MKFKIYIIAFLAFGLSGAAFAQEGNVDKRLLGKHRGHIFQESFDACKNSNTEEPCKFTIRDREVSGVCTLAPEGEALACKPDFSKSVRKEWRGEGQERGEHKRHHHKEEVPGDKIKTEL